MSFGYFKYNIYLISQILTNNNNNNNNAILYLDFLKERRGEMEKLLLPDNETRKKQLQIKLFEYKKRISPYRAPEMQMSTICKISVLERLLKDGQVDTEELSREMFEVYGSGFSVHAFNNACGVIDDYCKTGGKNTHGGTGL